MPSTGSSAPVGSHDLLASDDEEDYVPDETDEAEENAAMNDVDVEPSSDDVTDEASGSRPRRGRQYKAPVLAVKQRSQRNTRSGARPVAGRKRKKVIASSSDEEE